MLHGILEPHAGNAYAGRMPSALDQLTGYLMQLPPASRAEIAEKPVESLDFPSGDESGELRAAEAVRRRDEVRSGQVQPVPGEQVIEEARRIVGR